ncbi:MAG: hypothetical protein ACRCXZ_01105, partial [Patescibacteria group bacterium]
MDPKIKELIELRLNFDSISKQNFAYPRVDFLFSAEDHLHHFVQAHLKPRYGLLFENYTSFKRHGINVINPEGVYLHFANENNQQPIFSNVVLPTHPFYKRLKFPILDLISLDVPNLKRLTKYIFLLLYGCVTNLRFALNAYNP